MKKKIIAALVTAAAVAAMTACGNNTGSDTSEAQGSAVTETSSETSETSSSSEGLEGTVAAYEILGLQDMPECNYLDCIAGYHYIQVYDAYALGIVTEQTEAVDGVNTYQENASSITYSVDGHIVSINENSKSYMEYDMGEDTIELAQSQLNKAMEEGINVTGREFQGKGSGIIPLYSDDGDDQEYEYYEYLTDASTESMAMSTLERFYMNDGDVFAIYTKATLGETETEMTKVIKSIKTDIPEGTFTIPDLSGYERID